MVDINHIHCSYHKCLTVYYGRVMDAVLNRLQPWGKGYRHYNGHLEDFCRGFTANRVSSINNRALDLDSLGGFRLSRFIRDPRDLLVSGYFYHRRGAEDWVRLEAPSDDDWYFANGRVPQALRVHGGSFAQYLESVPIEEGLLAELEFRGPHFESMARWPESHPDIALFRYEDILGNELEMFSELSDFHDFSTLERRFTLWMAKRYSLHRRVTDSHVRNPQPGQWRQAFTPRIRTAFDAKYGALIKQLGYSSD